MKVIYHVDEMERWPLALGNIKNMAAYYREHGEDFTIEALANAAAVKAYLGRENVSENGGVTASAGCNAHSAAAAYCDDMKSLADEGIVFAACNNALKANSITSDQLYGFVRVVPAGVVELAAKQSEGYAYIRP